MNEILKYEFKEGLPHEFEIVALSDVIKNFEETITIPHRTGFYHVFWFQKGGPSHLVDFNPLQIEDNTLMFLNKDIVQRFDKNNKYFGKVIIFTDNFFCKSENDSKYLQSNILFDDLYPISLVKIPEQSKTIELLFQQIETEGKESKDDFQSDIIRNILKNIFLFSEREKRKQEKRTLKQDAKLELVFEFKNVLEKQYKVQKLVSIYAAQLNITEKKLNQATSKTLGKTPKQMIDARINLEAKRLLAHTNESVKAIGFDIGFEESTNFIKYFKKHNNATPVEFREQFSA